MSRLFALSPVLLVLVLLGCGQPAAEVAQNEKSSTVEQPAPKPAPKPNAGRPPEKVLATTAEKTDEPPEKDLTNEDPGLDTKIEAALPEIDRLDKQTVDSAVTSDPSGQPDPTPPGSAPSPAPAFPGRIGATKNRLIREGGGNAESERAVALGLAWLAKQQKADGSWEYDQGSSKEKKAAATGMALLAFLGAGETHKAGEKEERKHQKTVNAGLAYLMKQCPVSGPNAGKISTDMYEHAIATLALCEAYGLTKDPNLKPYAQAAVNYLQKSQDEGGSWGYSPGTKGDTSIVGWQIQALSAAKLTKDLVVDDRVIKKAVKFLDSTAAGSRKSMYGYADKEGAAPGTALTAVGLLCRYYIDNWGPSHPGMIDGVAGLVKNPPIYKGENVPELKNLYYYYYATQVVHFYEGEDWKNWNEGPKQKDGTRKGGMRDWLVKSQNKKDGEKLGSWDPEGGFFGSSCGRVGTTAMSVLTLEVYYRHLPLYKRGADGNAVKILEDK